MEVQKTFLWKWTEIYHALYMKFAWNVGIINALFEDRCEVDQKTRKPTWYQPTKQPESKAVDTVLKN